MRLIEKVIGYISPKTAFKRAQTIKKLESLERSYSAANSGRRNTYSRLSESTANQEILPNISTLRTRSRDNVRNNPYAFNAIKRITSSVVGTGIRPKPNLSEKSLREKIMEFWKDWAEDSTNCDYLDQLNFYSLQRLVMRAVAEGGEALILRRKVKTDTNIVLQLQVLEGDYLDSTKDEVKENSKVEGGVAFDKKGKIIGYWVFEAHPSTNPKSRLIKASEVAHVYEVLRAGQTRGVPFGLAGMQKMKDYDDYSQAEIIKQKTAACFAGFVVDPEVEERFSDKETQDQFAHIEPGAIEYLSPGQQITFANPPKVEGFGDFTLRTLQSISAGYGISYEALTNDYSNVNYSSGRMGWIAFHENVQTWQDDVMMVMCRKVWSWFIESLLETNLIPESSKCTATWTKPQREMVDVAKEIKGLQLKVRNGFCSWSEAIRKLGYDPDKVVEELKADKDLAEKLGLILDCFPDKLKTENEIGG